MDVARHEGQRKERSMSKYRVPEGGLDAAEQGVADLWDAMPSAWNPSQAKRNIAQAASEAFIRWQSENGPALSLPNAKQIANYLWAPNETCVIAIVKEGLRRLYVAPEPEIPEEVKDLLVESLSSNWRGSEVNEAIIEAYNRGRKGRA
jgi:hypothetical protein